MAGIQESLEPTVNEMESVIQEQIESVRQALEKHSNKLREKAEQDSSQIITQAKDEAERSLAQARQEAKAESARIIAAAKNEAEQVTRESNEQAARVRQESARVITDAREKASVIVNGIIERGKTQAQSELVRVASETRSRSAELLKLLSQSIEQVIGQAGNNIKIEFDRLAPLIAEAGDELQSLIETAEKESTEKETAEKEAIEKDTAEKEAAEKEPTGKETAEKEATGKEAGEKKAAQKEEANTEAEEKPRQAPAEGSVTSSAPISPKTESPVHPQFDRRSGSLKDGDDGKAFKGCVKLEMVPPFDQERLEAVPPWLSRLPGVKVISTGGYTRANRWITTYTIDLEQPVLLLKALKNMPPVKDVSENKGNIVVTLR